MYTPILQTGVIKKKSMSYNNFLIRYPFKKPLYNAHIKMRDEILKTFPILLLLSVCFVVIAANLRRRTWNAFVY